LLGDNLRMVSREPTAVTGPLGDNLQMVSREPTAVTGPMGDNLQMVSREPTAVTGPKLSGSWSYSMETRRRSEETIPAVVGGRGHNTSGLLAVRDTRSPCCSSRPVTTRTWGCHDRSRGTSPVLLTCTYLARLPVVDDAHRYTSTGQRRSSRSSREERNEKQK
jgi:hypothetical protein